MTAKGPQVSCCEFCGRDTRSLTGVCNRCYGHMPKGWCGEEQKGRSTLPPFIQLIEEDDYSEESTSDDRFSRSNMNNPGTAYKLYNG